MKKAIYFVFFILGVSRTSLAQTIYLYAGTGGGYSGDNGPAISAKFSCPTKMCTDAAGNLYVADNGNNCVRKITSAGVVTTIAGTGIAGFSGDGSPATSAKLSIPNGLAIDGSGNLYIVDSGNNRIRVVNSSGIINTFAGTGGSGYSGDGGSATTAQIGSPIAIRIDGSGNFYLSHGSVVRKISTSGTITTVAGTASSGYLGDGGPATSARLNGPSDISIDPSGNLYIADFGNNRIRTVNNLGIISTLSGTFTAGYSGDGGPASQAELNGPRGLWLDAAGNLYITDSGNHCVRRINSSGMISTFSGTNAICGSSGDGGSPLSAELCMPIAVTQDGSGNTYISDCGNDNIRVICPTNCFAGIGDVNYNSQVIKLYPNPASTNARLELGNLNVEGATLELTDAIGTIILKQTYSGIIDVSTLASGVYQLNLKPVSGKAICVRFVKQ